MNHKIYWEVTQQRTCFPRKKRLLQQLYSFLLLSQTTERANSFIVKHSFTLSIQILLLVFYLVSFSESVGNRTSSSGQSVGGGGSPSPRALPSLSAAAVVSAVAPSSSSASSSSSKTVGVTSPPTIPTASATYYPVTPSILSLVRSQSFDYSVNTNKPAMSKTNNESSIAVTPIPLMLARSSASHNVNHPDYNYNSTISSSSSSSFDVLMNSSTSPFVTLNSTVLRAQYKSNAMLPCNVRNSGDGVTVSSKTVNSMYTALLTTCQERRKLKKRETEKKGSA